MATLIRNVSLGNFDFPPPYRGTIAAGGAAICDDSTATLVAAIGDQVGVLRFEQIPDGQPATIRLLTSADVPDGSIGTADLAASAVTTAKIADANVTTAKLADTVADSIPGTPTIAAGVEAAHAIIATVTMKDVQGNTLAQAQCCDVWLSDTAGAAPSAVAPSGAVTVAVGVQVAAVVAKTVLRVKAHTDGTFTVSVTEAAAKSYFVNVAIGTKVASLALVFAG